MERLVISGTMVLPRKVKPDSKDALGQFNSGD